MIQKIEFPELGIKESGIYVDKKDVYAKAINTNMRILLYQEMDCDMLFVRTADQTVETVRNIMEEQAYYMFIKYQFMLNDVKRRLNEEIAKNEEASKFQVNKEELIELKHQNRLLIQKNGALKVNLDNKRKGYNDLIIKQRKLVNEMIKVKNVCETLDISILETKDNNIDEETTSQTPLE